MTVSSKVFCFCDSFGSTKTAVDNIKSHGDFYTVSNHLDHQAPV
jgi:hypothetical protein